jgi:hypothetical protein
MPHDSLHTVFLAAEILAFIAMGVATGAVLKTAELPKK